MKIVIAIEGMDGSGKSSMARLTEELCARYDQRFTRIGLRTSPVPSLPA